MSGELELEETAMGQVAPRVHTDDGEIRRLEALAASLPDEAIVAVSLDDGGRVAGTVSTRPIVQVFLDAEGNEGTNALLRIDDAADPAHAHYLWLDQVVRVEQLGTS